MEEMLLIIYIIFFGLLMLAVYGKGYAKYYLMFKSMTSVIFVMLAFWVMREKLFWLWLMAFLFCFLGDVLLGMDERKEKNRFFVWGLVSFVTGHVFFIIRMSGLTSFELWDLILPAGIALVTFFLIRHPKFHVGVHKRAVILYSLIVTLLCVKGYDMLLLDRYYWNVFVGSVLFFISDFLLLFIYFYEDKLKIMRFFNLLTYYGAVFLLACTVFR